MLYIHEVFGFGIIKFVSSKNFSKMLSYFVAHKNYGYVVKAFLGIKLSGFYGQLIL